MLIVVEPGSPDDVQSFNARLAHEIEHGVQVDNGEIGFKLNDAGEWRALFQDIGDEVRAHDAAVRSSTPSDLVRGILGGYYRSENKVAFLKGTRTYGGLPVDSQRSDRVLGVAPGAVLNTGIVFFRTAQ